ncbi:hypothetical protein [Exiguobacterium profundum]
MTLSPIVVISINPIAVKGALTVAQKKYVRMPKRKDNKKSGNQATHLAISSRDS